MLNRDFPTHWAAKEKMQPSGGCNDKASEVFIGQLDPFKFRRGGIINDQCGVEYCTLDALSKNAQLVVLEKRANTT